MKYYKIKIDFNDVIEFPQNVHEERYSISIEEIRQILDVSKFKQKGYYLCLISSGSRPVEILGLRKKDFFWTGTKFRAHIPAYLTKKKISRTIFFSLECNSYLNTLLKKHEDDQTIFTKNPILKNARTSEDSILHKRLIKLGMDYKFETTGYFKINLYCFRGYFFTKAIRVFNEDIAHSMIGHGAYLQQYQRRNDLEKEELYDELESELLIYDQNKNTNKIRRLEEANTKLTIQYDQIQKQETRIKNLEKLWMNNNIQPTI